MSVGYLCCHVAIRALSTRLHREMRTPPRVQATLVVLALCVHATAPRGRPLCCVSTVDLLYLWARILAELRGHVASYQPTARFLPPRRGPAPAAAAA